MKTRLIVCLFALTGLIAWGGTRAFTEDEKPEPKPMNEMEMWQKMMQWAQPAEHHKPLEALCGKWTTKGKMWSSMGEMAFEGKCENRWILGGRFVETLYEGPFMGGKFEGRGLTGYDNGKQQYQNVWLMTMSSAIGTGTGTYDAEKKTFEFKSSTYMADGKTYATREVTVIKSADEHVSTSYSTPPGGKEVKEMEIVYTRVKEK